LGSPWPVEVPSCCAAIRADTVFEVLLLAIDLVAQLADTVTEVLVLAGERAHRALQITQLVVEAIDSVVLVLLVLQALSLFFALSPNRPATRMKPPLALGAVWLGPT